LAENADASARAALVVAFVIGRWQRFAKSGFRKFPGEALEVQLPILVA
jgi:TetR/AcrR family transcriptional regulator